MCIILLIILSLVFAWKIHDENSMIPILMGIGAMFVLIYMLLCLSHLVSGRTIDEKIKMYQEQNTKIEYQIKETIEAYQNFEKKTFEELKPENYIAIASTYPELKSNEQVKEQINLYISNNEKITKLKEEKIDLKTFRWWLYFG